MEQSATGLKPGSTLGTYAILKRLGAGGMSFVYLAEHRTLGRLVAIKVLRPEYSVNVDAVQRFFLEARAVNQIRHPHIVEITDFCTDDQGDTYYVMEFLEGRDVDGLLAGRHVSMARALDIARQAASALAAVHEAGIVHRDFKGANVFVTTDAEGNDWVKLLDFGVAKLSDTSGKRLGVSVSGMTVGTPEFMAPEQATGKEVDARSDIYSFGVLLYQMVTGRLPFQGENFSETTYYHLHKKPVRPRRLQRRVPRELDRLIMRCLAKSPRDRPPSMKDLQPELAMIAGDLRTGVDRARRHLLQAAAVLAVLGALLAWAIDRGTIHPLPIARAVATYVQPWWPGALALLPPEPVDDFIEASVPAPEPQPAASAPAETIADSKPLPPPDDRTTRKGRTAKRRR